MLFVTSIKSFGGADSTLQDSLLGFFSEGEITLDELGQSVSFGDTLEESALINLGVVSVGNLDIGFRVFTNMSVISRDLAETFGDGILNGLCAGEADKSN